jgi:anti-anti-sigma regulatory factor
MWIRRDACVDSIPMARIRTVLKGERTVVMVTGRLTADDMGRLEHSCSPALTSPALPLQIDLRGVTHVDGTATAVLQRLAARGAVVTIAAAEPC